MPWQDTLASGKVCCDCKMSTRFWKTKACSLICRARIIFCRQVSSFQTRCSQSQTSKDGYIFLMTASALPFFAAAIQWHCTYLLFAFSFVRCPQLQWFYHRLFPLGPATKLVAHIVLETLKDMWQLSGACLEVFWCNLLGTLATFIMSKMKYQSSWNYIAAAMNIAYLLFWNAVERLCDFFQM